MKVALISDIHGNAAALHQLYPRLEQADCVMCLGDFVGYYCQINEVMDALRPLNPICVLGNHDHFLLHGCPPSAPDSVQWSIQHAQEVISQPNHHFLAALPLVWSGEVGGCRFLLAHGSPWRPLTDYLYRDRCDCSALRAFDVDVVAFGQTHRPWLDERERPSIVNVGSVGQSRHVAAQACMTLFDTEDRSIVMIERSYDPTAVLEHARQLGAGEWITKHMM